MDDTAALSIADLCSQAQKLGRSVYVCGANEEACTMFQQLAIIAAGPGRLSPGSNRCR